MKRNLVFLVSFIVMIFTSPKIFALDAGLFQKVAEFKIPSLQVRNAVLLSEGLIAYYWERTRPATEEEKKRRAEWFDKEWEKLRQKAEQEGIPEIEKGAKVMAQKLEEEKSKMPIIVRPMVPIFSAIFRGLSSWLHWVVEYTYPIARQHFINQPVVEEAGINIWDPKGKTKKILSVDISSLYGKESWERYPTNGFNLIASPDGRYVVLHTEEDPNAFNLFEIREEDLFFKGQIRGSGPLKWSYDGKYLALSKEKEKLVYVFSSETLKEVIRCNFDFDRRALRAGSSQSSWLQDIALGDGRLAIALLTDLGICKLSDGSLNLPDVAILRRIGPPKSITFGKDGKTLYVASLRGFFVVDTESFTILNQYLTMPGDGFYFQLLAGVSPDGRYAAVLHGRERDYGWATLFIWDIYQNRIIQRIGTEPGQMLNTISSGFGGIYPPVKISPDWRYLLAIRQDGVLELYQRRP